MGMKRTGKSHSRTLITFDEQDKSVDFDFIFIDLSRMQPNEEQGAILAWQVGERIAKQMKLGFSTAINGLSEKQWAQDFCDKLSGEMLNTEKIKSISVLDSFAKKPLSEEVYDLIEELAYQITIQLDMLRLRMLDFDKAPRLQNVIQKKFHHEQIAPVGEQELYSFFVRLYEARERRKGIDPMADEAIKNAITQDATNAVVQVLRFADPLEARPYQDLNLRVLYSAIVDECKKIL